jgi:hypothetical protein
MRFPESRAMTSGYYFRVVAKALALFVVFDLLQAAVGLPGRLETLSIYRHLVPPLARMDIMRDYPSSVMWRLEPLLDAHEIGRSRAAGEFRVAVLGDSGSFDLFSPARDAIPGRMSALGTRIGGRLVRAYNLSYQTPNPLKDLVIEEHALKRQPDAIVWFVTLYDLAADAPPPFRENVHLLLRVNRDDLRSLADRFSLSTWETRRLFATPDRFWRRSVLFTGERYRDFSLLLARGALDALTPGDPSDTFRARRPWIGSVPLPPEPLFDERGAGEPAMPNARWETLSAGEALARARGVPLLLVNDPIFRGSGPGAEREYNSFYGRRLYDRYRATLARFCTAKGIPLLDLWDFLSPEEFGDTPQHYLPAANARVARAVNEELLRIAR